MIDVRRCSALLFVLSLLCTALLAVPVSAQAASSKPMITGLSTHSGGTRGDTTGGHYSLIVHGRGLSHATSVAFGTVQTTWTTDSDTTLNVRIPRHPAGLIHVWVRSSGGTSVPTDSAFTYHPSPWITRLASDDGATTGSNQVTISGGNLTGATSVTFDGIPATGFRVIGTGLATVIAPRHAAPGIVYVVIHKSFGNSLPVRYRYGRPSTVHWSTPSVIDPDEELAALSCPTTDFCAATDHQNNWLIENAGRWSAPARPAGGGTVSCTSATFCMSAFLYLTWAWDGHTWNRVPNPFATSTDLFDVQQVVCESSSFCLARGGGAVSTWDGTSWSTPQHPLATSSYRGVDVQAISCWAAGQCGASAAGSLLELDDTGWHFRHASHSANLTTLSCVSSDFCQAGYLDGSLEQLTKTTSLSSDDVLSEMVEQVVCTGANSCVAVGPHSVATWDGSSWSASSASAVGVDNLYNTARDILSCPAPVSGSRQCTAVGAHSSATFTW